MTKHHRKAPPTNSSGEGRAARMLRSISVALTRHSEVCLADVVEILLNPGDHSFLGWDDFQGIPVRPSGVVRPLLCRIVCERDQMGAAAAEMAAQDEVKVVKRPVRYTPLYV